MLNFQERFPSSLGWNSVPAVRSMAAYGLALNGYCSDFLSSIFTLWVVALMILFSLE